MELLKKLFTKIEQEEAVYRLGRILPLEDPLLHKLVVEDFNILTTLYSDDKDYYSGYTRINYLTINESDYEFIKYKPVLFSTTKRFYKKLWLSIFNQISMETQDIPYKQGSLLSAYLTFKPSKTYLLKKLGHTVAGNRLIHKAIRFSGHIDLKNNIFNVTIRITEVQEQLNKRD